MKKQENTYRKSNKKLWDQLTKTHTDDPFYNVEDFLAGASTLKTPELLLLNDVSGKSILHLQCHFGLDTLSLARLGGKVTGVDFSTEAIRKARELAGQANMSAEFLESDVYDLTLRLKTEFDIVFTSYGVLPWLPDLSVWATTVKEMLKPGGDFIMVEFHPFLNLIDDEPSRFQFDYFERKTPIRNELSQSYTGKKLPQKMEEYSWNHSLSSILKSLLSAGLKLEVFEEYDYSPFPCFENMVERAPGEYVWDTQVSLPYLIALKMKNH